MRGSVIRQVYWVLDERGDRCESFRTLQEAVGYCALYMLPAVERETTQIVWSNPDDIGL